MVILALPYLFQLLLIIHAARNGNLDRWLWILIVLPGVGGLAYLALEVLPDLVRQGPRQVGSLADRVIPTRQVKRAEEAFAHSPTAQNAKNLAEAWDSAGNYDEALRRYTELLQGPWRGDPGLTLRLAELHALDRRPDLARPLLDELARRDELGSVHAQGLHAYVRHRSGEAGALGDLERLFDRTGNLELGYWLGLARIDAGNPSALEAIVARMQDEVRRHPQLRRSMDRSWIRRTRDLARQRLATSEAPGPGGN